MNSIKPNPAFRLMPSLTDVAFLMPVVFLFTRMQGLSTLLQDGDTGFHIRTGDWIRTNGAVPRQDIFSYTMPDQPWFAWEWLWDVWASWLHENWGLGGISLANIFLICLTFALLNRLILRKCGNPIISIGLTVLAVAGSTVHWLARPHLVTLLMTVVFMSILDRIREGRTGLLWWLPALTLLWTNLHAGFLVGLVILGCYGAGCLIRAAVLESHDQRRSEARAALPYFATLAGCLAASLVNPYFYSLHVHIVKYFGNPYAMNNIMEFQSADFHHVTSIFLEAMLVLGAGTAIWYAIRRQFSEVLLVALWAHAALIAVRNVPLFMVIAAPFVAVAMVAWGRAIRDADVAGWLKTRVARFEEAAEELVPIERIRRVHVFPALVLIVIGAAMNSSAAGAQLKAQYDVKSYPEDALAVLSPSLRVFTHDEWGDYLIYRLYHAGTKVFVDGRSDFYGEKFSQDYVDLLNATKYDWEDRLQNYRVDAVLLPVKSPLVSTIKESSHWRVVYDDGLAIVFRSNQAVPEHGEQVSTVTAVEKGWNGNVSLPRSIRLEGREIQSVEER